ncbi:S-adenosyl-L-methionine-dependent methyltransferase [Artemisia annua]|uniref:Methyltransferase n=1 Tax=Artemisia annua TaxID=35608 RepID=A0A2U1KR15_ARTAN|nr:S-adenosyl-L-methionine-dependent methyltransferase [Artemisia annua]
MGSKTNPTNRRRSPLSIIIVFGLCCFFYLLRTWQKSGFGKGDSIAMDITKKTECEDNFATLDFDSHHSIPIPDSSRPKSKMFKPCNYKYTDYTPCHEQDRAMKFPRENMVYRERYSTPFPWPKGRDYVHYANVPYKHLTVEKANQHWVEYQGNVFKFPGGGTMFPQGADAYIDELATVIPIKDGSVRTALDTAYLMNRNVLAFSFAPRDNHEAQVQFALERGVPAFIGVLGSIKLPFPARSFDMAQCSRRLIPWGENDGTYLMEVDRVLRPGGFWILSGPPINWKTYYQTWKSEQAIMEVRIFSSCVYNLIMKDNLVPRFSWVRDDLTETFEIQQISRGLCGLGVFGMFSVSWAVVFMVSIIHWHHGQTKTHQNTKNTETYIFGGFDLSGWFRCLCLKIFKDPTQIWCV